MAMGAWMYVQYTGKHRAVGVEIERGAEMLWNRVSFSLPQSFTR